MRILLLTALLALPWFATSCSSSLGTGNLGGPSVEERTAQIASEPTGDFFYGRRYFVQKTRFWGYLREPRQPWSRAKLVIFREDRMRSPDRLAEGAPAGQRYGFDQNFDYKIRGFYSGQTAYEPNSDQFLPVFTLTGYEVIDRNPGWIFRPDDTYSPTQVTLVPR